MFEENVASDAVESVVRIEEVLLRRTCAAEGACSSSGVPARLDRSERRVSSNRTAADPLVRRLPTSRIGLNSSDSVTPGKGSLSTRRCSRRRSVEVLSVLSEAAREGAADIMGDKIGSRILLEGATFRIEDARELSPECNSGV